MNERSRVLTLVDYYLPGYKAGGPLRTIANMVDRLSDELEFLIITRNTDLGDDAPYPDIEPGAWYSRGKADVLYLSKKQRSLSSIRTLINAIDYDALYLNSLFSPPFTVVPLLLRRLRMVPRKPVVIAPRGELAPGALGIRSRKKRVYLTLAKLFGLYKGVTWQASGEHEAEQIKNCFGKAAKVVVAPDLPPLVSNVGVEIQRKPKIRGKLQIIFLSRISPMKNLLSALTALRSVEGDVVLDIYGPLEDKDYWEKCQAEIIRLPVNVKVRYQGAVPPDQVDHIMRDHDLFFLPSLGENFGHVILEAMIAGCPVLISDRTPWRNLEAQGVGWDLPLDSMERFSSIINRCVNMDAEVFNEWSKRARNFGLHWASDEETVNKTRELFNSVLI